MLDLAAEGRYGETSSHEAEIRRIDTMKTGAIIAFAVEAGAIIARADEAARGNLLRFGRAIGQAFQIADDLLDREGSAESVGKRTGKDRQHGKATLIDILGLEAARQECSQLVDRAIAALQPFGAKADTLRQAARFTATRKS